MKEVLRPQINASKIMVGSGVGGAIFTAGSMLIFLAGLPVLRYMFPAAIILGCGFALVLRFAKHRTPGTPWLLSTAGQGIEAPAQRERRENPGSPARIFLESPVVWLK